MKESTDDNEVTFKSTFVINLFPMLCLKSVPYQCFQPVNDRLDKELML